MKFTMRAPAHRRLSAVRPAGSAPLLVLTAIVATLALLLGGCSSGGTTSDNGSSNGSSSKTLTVWHYFAVKNQVQLMTDYGKLFEKNNPGWKVNNVFVPQDKMVSKLVAAAGTKTGPDVVVYNGAATASLALPGTLMPLDDKWNGYADKDQFPDSVLHKVDGKIYTVQGYVNLLGLWYNKDVLDKIGVKPPTTLTELNEDMAKAKKAGYGGITLTGIPEDQSEWQAYPWLTAAGFDYANPSVDALAKGFGTVNDWVQKGYLSKEATTYDQTIPFQKFAAGNIAFAENGNWQIGYAKSNAKFNYGVAPLPIGPTGKIYLGGEGVGIGTYSKNPDMAWKYMTETFLDKNAELTAMKDVGSIPARKDSGADTSVSNNPLLKPFADEIANKGAAFPPAVIQPKDVAKLQLAVGQAWSSVIGGQQSPDAAAKAVMAKISPYLSK